MTNKNSKRREKRFCNLICNFDSFGCAQDKLCILIFTFLCGLCGCSVVEYFRAEEPPYDEELSESYRQTKLKESTAADVLAMIHRLGYEQDPKRKKMRLGTQLLSQSKSAIASLGEKKKGHKIWFNMVTFDENELTAKGKYLFIVDDRPNIWEEPRKKLSFDCEMVLETEVLDKPYTDENARRIAILKRVLENVRKDIDEVGSDNKKLDICGMLINQALETILVKLDSSPVLATGLSEPSGVEFDHISFGKGKIQMAVEGDVVAVKMRLGSLVKYFDEQEEEDLEEK